DSPSDCRRHDYERNCGATFYQRSDSGNASCSANDENRGTQCSQPRSLRDESWICVRSTRGARLSLALPNFKLCTKICLCPTLHLQLPRLIIRLATNGSSKSLRTRRGN